MSTTDGRPIGSELVTYIRLERVWQMLRTFASSSYKRSRVGRILPRLFLVGVLAS